ncbi:TIGR00730 family Rossman fold protein [Candidatus Dependentiae bacterium]|nr:TIGR00730 family Rossman fold protein [Candidatus Dependentiae bacterium]
MFSKRLFAWLVLFFSHLHVFFQLMYGAWKILNIPKPMVSIFGGSRLNQDDPYAVKAHEFAQRLVNADISVVTGGGPGVMEAASCGAMVKQTGKKARSVGISVKDLNEGRNPCVQDYIELNYFFARKWLLTHYSAAFIVFPGGFGTLDELAEVLTLIQTKEISRVPIFLIGVEYWDDFMVWVKKEALEHGLIDKEDLNLFTLTDDLEKAFCSVRNKCKMV